MGSWSLTKKNTLTKNMKAIETLGTVNVLCTDKTGTITENKMIVEDIYTNSETFIKTLYQSCPQVAYDPMEIALKKYCQENEKINTGSITKEYPFKAETKMMGQIWNNKELCVKGAYENVLPLCNLDKENYKQVKSKINEYSKEGYRVLAVRSA